MAVVSHYGINLALWVIGVGGFKGSRVDRIGAMGIPIVTVLGDEPASPRGGGGRSEVGRGGGGAVVARASSSWLAKSTYLHDKSDACVREGQTGVHRGGGWEGGAHSEYRHAKVQLTVACAWAARYAYTLARSERCMHAGGIRACTGRGWEGGAHRPYSHVGSVFRGSRQTRSCKTKPCKTCASPRVGRGP